MYNPQSHQWRLYWDNQKVGVLDPPQVGEFKDGVGEFFAQDTINGKTILIRFHWTNLTTGHAPLRAVFLRRRRQDLGGELDHRPDARQRQAGGWIVNRFQDVIRHPLIRSLRMSGAL